VVADALGQGAGAGEGRGGVLDPAECQQGEAEVGCRPLRGVVDPCGGGDPDGLLEQRDGVGVGTEPLDAVAVVVQDAGQAPAVVEVAEEPDGVLRRPPRGGLVAALEPDLRPDERDDGPAYLPEAGVRDLISLTRSPRRLVPA
jgi:hypothetical protein